MAPPSHPMNKTTFIAELRRRANNSLLFLTRNRHQARKWNIHFQCWQVWCRSVQGEPYAVLPICAERGIPREPADRDIEMVLSMSADRLHQGAKSWIGKMANQEIRRAEDRQRKGEAQSRDWLQHEGMDRMLHRTKGRLLVAMPGGGVRFAGS